MKAVAPVSFAGSRLDETRHVCAFLNSDDEKCQMDWAANGPAHIGDLLEFEARVNEVWRRHDDAVICVYDLAKFGGDTVVDIMRTHPMVVIGGTLHHNPFFVPPEEFLREFRDRRGTAPRRTTA